MINPFKKSFGASLIVLSSLFYASYGIWTTLMGDYFGSYTASAIRSVLVLLIIVPFAIARNKIGPFNIGQHTHTYFWLLIASATVWGPLYYAILNAGVGVALAITYGSLMVSMMFFGWLLSKELLTKLKLFSALLGVVGLWMVFAPSAESGTPTLPLFAAMIAGAGSGAVAVLVRNLPYSATQSTIVSWAISVVANAVMVLIVSEQLPAFALDIEWLYLLIFAIASVLASLTFMTGLKLIDAGIAGVLGLLEIVFGVLIGIVFFNESIVAMAIIGVIVVLLAAATPYAYELARESSESATGQ